MGIKQEIKKEMPISSLNIHATDVTIAISSFHEGLKMQIRSRTESLEKEGHKKRGSAESQSLLTLNLIP